MKYKYPTFAKQIEPTKNQITWNPKTPQSVRGTYYFGHYKAKMLYFIYKYFIYKYVAFIIYKYFNLLR